MAKTTRTVQQIGTTPAHVQQLAQSILLMRGKRVILDRELAAIYAVPTGRLNGAVKRNIGRFPEDFLFRLSAVEVEALNRSQIATGSQKHRDPRFPPYAFTEHGAIMAATIVPESILVQARLAIEDLSGEPEVVGYSRL